MQQENLYYKEIKKSSAVEFRRTPAQGEEAASAAMNQPRLPDSSTPTKIEAVASNTEVSTDVKMPPMPFYSGDSLLALTQEHNVRLSPLMGSLLIST